MDNEIVYDERIAPLMAQIIEVCQRHGIPMLASYQLSNGSDPIYCSTVLPGDSASEWFTWLQGSIAASAPREQEGEADRG